MCNMLQHATLWSTKQSNKSHNDFLTPLDFWVTVTIFIDRVKTVEGEKATKQQLCSKKETVHVEVHSGCKEFQFTHVKPS